MTDIKLFDSEKVRTHWDAEKEKWYFSIVDVISILTEQPTFQGARNYWKVLKNRLRKEGNETVTKCNRLKLVAEDGKLRETDVADTEQAKGVEQNAKAGKKGGKIAKDARLQLEAKTEKKVVTGENFLPAGKVSKKLKK